MARERVRFGIVGCGGIAREYTAAAANQQLKETVRIDQVSDALPDAAQLFADQIGAQAVSTERLLANPDIDAVIITTPTFTHADLAVQALTASKSVLVNPWHLPLKMVSG